MGVGYAQGGVFSTSVKTSTRRRSGGRRTVLPTAALRTMRVSVLLVNQLHCGDGVCKLCCGGAGDGRAVGKDFKTCSLPTASIQDTYIRVSFPPLPFVHPKHMHAHIYTCTYHIHLYTYMFISIPV